MTQAELMEYRQLRRDKKETEQILLDLDASSGGLRASVIDGLPHGSSRRDGLAVIILKYDKQKERYKERLADIIARMQLIEEAVNSLSHEKRRILTLYYIKGNSRVTFYQIAIRINYSERQVRRIHAEALRELEKI